MSKYKPMSEYKSMSNKELAAQCIVPRLAVDTYFENEQYRVLIDRLVELGVGGFCIFKGSEKNTQDLTSQLQAKSKIPLIFAADFEFGLPMRLSGGTAFPHAMALGKTHDPQKTLIISQLIAKESKSVGVKWNFAPVCDINSNIDNPIINIRSFGETADTVSQHIAYFIKGHSEENVLSCAKHFPGHGNTDKDSHLELPIIDRELNELKYLELLPFEKAVRNDVDSIMIGHLNVPAIDDSGMPMSLSKNAVDYIRTELNFNGLILTDALDMNAITNNFSSGIAALKAMEAGNNIALMPENPFEAIDNILEKAESNYEFREHLEKSAELLIRKKKKVGLIPYVHETSHENLSNMEHEKIALSVAAAAVEIDAKEIMIPLDTEKQFAGFAFLQREDDFQNASIFFKLLGQALENDCDFGFLNEEISDKDLEQLKLGIEDAKFLIFVFFSKSVAYSGSIDIPSRCNDILNYLADGRKVISVFFGNPYIASSIDYDLAIKTYSDSLASIAASIMIMTGRSQSDNTHLAN